MAPITVKNIPDDLYAELKILAEANRRSINSEIIVCIERRLNSHRPSTDEVVQIVRRLRQLTDAHPITAKQFNEAKAAGQLANTSGCSAYDCEFVALAKDVEVSLVTADKKLLNAFPQTTISPSDLVRQEG